MQGHKENVIDAVFSENSYKVISVSTDKTIRKWNFGRLLNPLAEFKNIDFSIFSPNGLKILTAINKTIKLHDLTGYVEKEFTGNTKRIKMLNFSTDGKYIASAGSDKTVRVWEVATNNNFISTFHHSKVNSVEFMPDSNLVLSGGNDSLIILWKPGEKDARKIIKAEAKINSAYFSQDKANIITAESSGNVVIRNLNGDVINTINAHEGSVLSAVFSPNKKYIASTGKDNKAALWKLNGENIMYFDGFSNKINSIEFSKDSKYILTASDNQTIKIYETSGNEIFTYKNEGKVKNAHFSQDGQYIVLNISDRGNKYAKLLVISPEKILELTNEIKIFGEFLKIDTLKPEKIKNKK